MAVTLSKDRISTHYPLSSSLSLLKDLRKMAASLKPLQNVWKYRKTAGAINKWVVWIHSVLAGGEENNTQIFQVVLHSKQL